MIAATVLQQYCCRRGDVGKVTQQCPSPQHTSAYCCCCGDEIVAVVGDGGGVVVAVAVMLSFDGTAVSGGGTCHPIPDNSNAGVR